MFIAPPSDWESRNDSLPLPVDNRPEVNEDEQKDKEKEIDKTTEDYKKARLRAESRSARIQELMEDPDNDIWVMRVPAVTLLRSKLAGLEFSEQPMPDSKENVLGVLHPRYYLRDLGELPSNVRVAYNTGKGGMRLSKPISKQIVAEFRSSLDEVGQPLPQPDLLSRPDKVYPAHRTTTKRRFPYPGMEENVDQKLKDAIQDAMMKQSSVIPEFEQVSVPTEEEMKKIEEAAAAAATVKEEDITDDEVGTTSNVVVKSEPLNEKGSSTPHDEKNLELGSKKLASKATGESNVEVLQNGVIIDDPPVDHVGEEQDRKLSIDAADMKLNPRTGSSNVVVLQNGVIIEDLRTEHVTDGHQNKKGSSSNTKVKFEMSDAPGVAKQGSNQVEALANGVKIEQSETTSVGKRKKKKKRSSSGTEVKLELMEATETVEEGAKQPEALPNTVKIEHSETQGSAETSKKKKRKKNHSSSGVEVISETAEVGGTTQQVSSRVEVLANGVKIEESVPEGMMEVPKKKKKKKRSSSGVNVKSDTVEAGGSSPQVSTKVEVLQNGVKIEESETERMVETPKKKRKKKRSSSGVDVKYETVEVGGITQQVATHVDLLQNGVKIEDSATEGMVDVPKKNKNKKRSLSGGEVKSETVEVGGATQPGLTHVETLSNGVKIEQSESEVAVEKRRKKKKKGSSSGKEVKSEPAELSGTVDKGVAQSEILPNGVKIEGTRSEVVVEEQRKKQETSAEGLKASEAKNETEGMEHGSSRKKKKKQAIIEGESMELKKEPKLEESAVTTKKEEKYSSTTGEESIVAGARKDGKKKSKKKRTKTEPQMEGNTGRSNVKVEDEGDVTKQPSNIVVEGDNPGPSKAVGMTDDNGNALHRKKKKKKKKKRSRENESESVASSKRQKIEG